MESEVSPNATGASPAGEVVITRSGATARTCARPDCNQAAAVRLLLDYPGRTATLAWITGPQDPNVLELCVDHADRFGPPHGYDLIDRRLTPAVTADDALAS